MRNYSLACDCGNIKIWNIDDDKMCLCEVKVYANNDNSLVSFLS